MYNTAELNVQTHVQFDQTKTHKQDSYVVVDDKFSFKKHNEILVLNDKIHNKYYILYTRVYKMKTRQ